MHHTHIHHTIHHSPYSYSIHHSSYTIHYSTQVKLVGPWQIGENNVITIPDYPFDPARGGTHEVCMEEYVYIDRSDFRMQDSEDYYGLGIMVYIVLCRLWLVMHVFVLYPPINPFHPTPLSPWQDGWTEIRQQDTLRGGSDQQYRRTHPAHLPCHSRHGGGD
ncbi:hypothetical protein EON63_00410 [archaeon]|nr:MAG: hypothetical protein EON63_00410 [archaeon]